MTSIYANSERPQRRAPRCGNCGGEGHNRRTCPTAERLRNAMDEDRWRREAAEAAAEVERQQRRQQARRDQQRAREQRRRAEQQQRDFEHQQRALQETEREQARRQRTSSNRIIIDGLVVQAEQEQRAWDMAQRALDNMARRMRMPDAPLRPEPAPRRRVRPRDDHTDDETEPIDLEKVAELPILRDTAIEMDECPICMETLGETGKIILKCGHSVCQGCFLQQMVHSTVIKKKNDCACPACRVKYIK
jgi:hypothetical protein